MKRILITGKNSYLGSSLESYLKQWPEKYSVDTLDVRGGCWRDCDFSSYDTVYHVAGIAHSDTGHASEEEKQKYYAVNTDLTLDVAEKAKKDGIRQFIFMSSIIVYGESAPIGVRKVITADTPLAPANFYGDSKRRAEEGLMRLHSQRSGGEFKVVILRSPMIYGKSSKGNYPQLSRIAQSLPFFPKVRNQRSMLYIINLCEFVRLMIDNEEDGVFFPQNKSYMSTSGCVREIAAVHGKNVRLVPGLELILKAAARLTPLINKAFGNLVIDKSLSQYKVDYRVVGTAQSIRETESR